MTRDLHLPETARDFGVVVVHPHPAMGGDRHHPLMVAIASGLASTGVAALRVDLRDPDVEPSSLALERIGSEFASEFGLQRLALVGYSWGSAVSLRARPELLRARVLVAPPVSMLDPGSGDGTPTLVLVPEHDQYGGPQPVADLMGSWPSTSIEVIHDTDHFLAGAIGPIADRTVEWLTATDQTA